MRHEIKLFNGGASLQSFGEGGYWYTPLPLLWNICTGIWAAVALSSGAFIWAALAAVLFIALPAMYLTHSEAGMNDEQIELWQFTRILDKERQIRLGITREFVMDEFMLMDKSDRFNLRRKVRQLANDYVEMRKVEQRNAFAGIEVIKAVDEVHAEVEREIQINNDAHNETKELLS
jgi:hypothetical protein